MVNMYFNGKSFVYCRKQEEKLIKLTYRGLILKKIIKFFKLFKRKIDNLNAETELKCILENK